MFSSSGCFRSIDCPLSRECTLLNCIFRHQSNREEDKQAMLDQPAVKRRRISPDPARSTIAQPALSRDPASKTFVGALVAPSSDLPLIEFGSSDGKKLDGGLRSDAYSITPAQRPISPPPVKRSGKAVTHHLSKPVGTFKQQKKQETLNPRMMPNSPADHKSRYLYLKKMYEGMKRLNEEVGKSSEASTKALQLSEDELVKLALDEEERLAKENGAVYANIIKLRIVAYSKRMTIDEWKAERVKARNSSISKSGKASTSDSLLTGLSEEEELQVLPQLITIQTGLDQYGYILSPSTDSEIKSAQDGVAASQGWEQCDRCKTRFQVFPERREDGALTSGGRCKHHFGRIVYPDTNSSGGSSSVKERIYSCCNEPVGASAGCVYGDSHVFKVSDGKRLGAVMQFQRTPENATVKEHSAVCFDCEMGYTVHGLELIRLTAISWPSGDDLLDVLVRPLGAVLDLNTRYSGVSPKDFLEAKPYDPDAVSVASPQQLSIVDSPYVARELLFKLLTPKTPLIGHAIENDLNTVRIVHPSIIDTVLLFPHPSGLPRRRALKALAKQVLNRDIQRGDGAAGHDSREDAVATGDLVRWKVGRRWKEMQHEGWKSEAGKLIPPPGYKGPTKRPSAQKGHDHNLKRSLADYKAELQQDAS